MIGVVAAGSHASETPPPQLLYPFDRTLELVSTQINAVRLLPKISSCSNAGVFIILF